MLRLESGRPGPSLLLLAHEDVVPANAADWQVPPFSGLIKDGYVWGRGAVDIKNLVAAHAVATARIAAQGGPAAGTLVYACTADEEEGSVGGARWLVNNRPDLVRTDYVINEGGGHFLERGGRRVYLLESGEKGTAQFRLIVKGEAGHASVPLRSGNAVVAAARVVEALVSHQLPLVIDGSSEELVRLLVDSPALRERLRDPRTAREALAQLARRDVQLADMIEPLYGFAFSPTIVHSNSVAVNVYPTRVEVSVDCRMLAGHDEQEVLTEVRTALDGVEADWDLEWVGPVVRGNSSPYPTPLSEAIRRTLRAARARGAARQQPLRRLHRLQLVPRRLPGHGGLQLRAAPRRGVRRGHAALPQRGRAHPRPRPRLPGAVRGTGGARAARRS